MARAIASITPNPAEVICEDILKHLVAGESVDVNIQTDDLLDDLRQTLWQNPNLILSTPALTYSPETLNVAIEVARDIDKSRTQLLHVNTLLGVTSWFYDFSYQPIRFTGVAIMRNYLKMLQTKFNTPEAVELTTAAERAILVKSLEYSFALFRQDFIANTTLAHRIFRCSFRYHQDFDEALTAIYNLAPILSPPTILSSLDNKTVENPSYLMHLFYVGDTERVVKHFKIIMRWDNESLVEDVYQSLFRAFKHSKFECTITLGEDSEVGPTFKRILAQIHADPKYPKNFLELFLEKSKSYLSFPWKEELPNAAEIQQTNLRAFNILSSNEVAAPITFEVKRRILLEREAFSSKDYVPILQQYGYDDPVDRFLHCTIECIVGLDASLKHTDMPSLLATLNIKSEYYDLFLAAQSKLDKAVGILLSINKMRYIESPDELRQAFDLIAKDFPAYEEIVPDIREMCENDDIQQHHYELLKKFTDIVQNFLDTIQLIEVYNQGVGHIAEYFLSKCGPINVNDHLKVNGAQETKAPDRGIAVAVDDKDQSSSTLSEVPGPVEGNELDSDSELDPQKKTLFLDNAISWFLDQSSFYPNLRLFLQKFTQMMLLKQVVGFYLNPHKSVPYNKDTLPFLKFALTYIGSNGEVRAKKQLLFSHYLPQDYSTIRIQAFDKANYSKTAFRNAFHKTKELFTNADEYQEWLNTSISKVHRFLGVFNINERQILLLAQVFAAMFICVSQSVEADIFQEDSTNEKATKFVDQFGAFISDKDKMLSFINDEDDLSESNVNSPGRINYVSDHSSYQSSSVDSRRDSNHSLPLPTLIEGKG